MIDGAVVISGWGRTHRTRVQLEHPRSTEQVLESLAGEEWGGLIARGAGRSYGDAAQNGGGRVLDMTALRGEPSVDVAQGVVDLPAGNSFAEVLLRLARAGHTLPVVPGTRHLTVGGAIAADVHGKNHPRAGSMATNLLSFTLCTPARGAVEVSRESEPDLFAATVGGMGLTGVITRARLRIVPMGSSESIADIDRVGSMEEAMALMSEAGPYTHGIAWLDLLSRGSAFGRAVVTRSCESPPRGHRVEGSEQPFPTRPVLGVPRGFPEAVLRPASVRTFNALHWRSSPTRERGRTISMAAQLFPLDVLGDWNRLYGSAGLVQYQFAVPPGGESLLRAIPELLRRRGLPMYLAVLKRFGAPSEGLISFPLEGWTIAIDLPASADGLEAGLREADEMLIGGGGRVYLAKDARMTAGSMAAMYPGLPRFREICDLVDPGGQLSSDLSRRLELRP